MGKGISSVVTAVILAITIITIISIIAISIPLAKSYIDKTRWASQVSTYEPPSQGGITSGPEVVGYCLMNTVGGITYVSCPSITTDQVTAPSQPPQSAPPWWWWYLPPMPWPPW
ncbi:hypothetical protein [Vulcanisaeta sp. JCM 14467]